MNDIQARYEEQFGPGNYIPPVDRDLLVVPDHGRRRDG
jgi:hypothetical protein